MFSYSSFLLLSTILWGQHEALFEGATYLSFGGSVVLVLRKTFVIHSLSVVRRVCTVQAPKTLFTFLIIYCVQYTFVSSSYFSLLIEIEL